MLSYHNFYLPDDSPESEVKLANSFIYDTLEKSASNNFLYIHLNCCSLCAYYDDVDSLLSLFDSGINICV